MTSRRITVLTFAAFAFAALLMPATEANAQSVWDVLRERARDQRDGDYQRGRGRDRDDDYGRGRRGGRLSDNERRQLREVARRIENRAASFQREVDRSLDNSRIDDTPREDRINERARQFREAAARFEDVAGDSDNMNSSRDEARRLLNEASQIERVLRRARLNSRGSGNWSQLRSDLRWVADFYGVGGGDFNGGRNNRGRDRGW